MRNIHIIFINMHTTRCDYYVCGALNNYKYIGSTLDVLIHRNILFPYLFDEVTWHGQIPGVDSFLLWRFLTVASKLFCIIVPEIFEFFDWLVWKIRKIFAFFFAEITNRIFWRWVQHVIFKDCSKKKRRRRRRLITYTLFYVRFTQIDSNKPNQYSKLNIRRMKR